MIRYLSRKQQQITQSNQGANFGCCIALERLKLLQNQFVEKECEEAINAYNINTKLLFALFQNHTNEVNMENRGCWGRWEVDFSDHDTIFVIFRSIFDFQLDIGRRSGGQQPFDWSRLKFFVINIVRIPTSIGWQCWRRWRRSRRQRCLHRTGHWRGGR